jgi:anti-sigma factor RsiW
MSLCDSIDTLAMAYLDDELAAEERHELDTHMTECAACKGQLERERADQSVVRRALAAPPAPDMLKARIARAIAAEEAAQVKAERKRWSQYLLPGSAVIAAAAAIAVFVGVRPSQPKVNAVAVEAVRQQTRQLPLEVQGASTGPWLRQHFAPQMEPPQLAETNSQVIGARLLPRGINGHDGALVSYEVNLTGQAFVLSVIAVRDVRDDEMMDGTEVAVGGRTMHVLEEDGHTMVTYVDANHIGYMFFAPDLSANELVWLVGKTSLVGP